MSGWKRAGVCLAAVAVVAGVAGCDDGDGGGKKRKKADGSPVSRVLSQSEIAKAVKAAFTTTSEAKSAKVRMTITAPAGTQGGGTTQISGVQGWDPAVMDVTVTGSALTEGAPDGPSQVRMKMLDNVMYMDMGPSMTAETGGKRWMKMDFEAAAKASGDAEMQKRMTAGLENMNQDPAEQLALLLQSPSIKHVGAEKVGGAQTEHYRGTLTFAEMIAANKAADLVPEKDRKTAIANAEKAGIKGYDTEIWVNEDHFPVRMAIGMKMPEGTVRIAATYSDFGTAATVEAPPAKDTFDLFKMIKDMKPSELSGGTGSTG
ncbi:hypothetical protein [Actinacidiphila glaucinigra]|uniref:hypothetical protein n=1 Tax=Actinacidiphila glaucinigra TaxID=235986 RepID=UPI00371CAF13